MCARLVGHALLRLQEAATASVCRKSYSNSVLLLYVHEAAMIQLALTVV